MKIGDILDTKCGECVIIGYVNSTSPIIIKFIKTNYIMKTSFGNLSRGLVKDPLYPSVYGIACLGGYTFTSTNNKKLYVMWRNMLRRCYDNNTQVKQPTYIGCTVVKRWHNFQNFCEDIIKMPNWNTPGFELDKDLRVLGNKKYGPKYCSFVPKAINASILSTYDNFTPIKNGYLVQVSFSGKKIRKTAKTKKEAKDLYRSIKRGAIQDLMRKYKRAIHKDVYNVLKSLEV